LIHVYGIISIPNWSSISFFGGLSLGPWKNWGDIRYWQARTIFWSTSADMRNYISEIGARYSNEVCQGLLHARPSCCTTMSPSMLRSIIIYWAHRKWINSTSHAESILNNFFLFYNKYKRVEWQCKNNSLWYIRQFLYQINIDIFSNNTQFNVTTKHIIYTKRH